MAQATAPREKNVTDGVAAVLKAARAFYFKSQSGGFGGMAGLPDHVCCITGTFVGIEEKRPGGSHKVTAKQLRVLERIAQAGGVAVVVDDPQQVVELLARLRDPYRCIGYWDRPRDLRFPGWPQL